MSSAALAVALLAVQFAVIAWSPWELPVRIALPATIALVPVALWPHRGMLGVWVIFVGLAANLAVILANGGLMPIRRDTVEEAIGFERSSEYASGEWIRGSKDVLVEPGQGAAVALGDRIIVRLGSGGFAASAGDVVVWCGMLLVAAEASWRWQRRTRRAHETPAVPNTGVPPPEGAEGSAPAA
jgi:hypothetical protein